MIHKSQFKEDRIAAYAREIEEQKAKSIKEQSKKKSPRRRDASSRPRPSSEAIAEAQKAMARKLSKIKKVKKNAERPLVVIIPHHIKNQLFFQFPE